MARWVRENREIQTDATNIQNYTITIKKKRNVQIKQKFQFHINPRQ